MNVRRGLGGRPILLSTFALVVALVMGSGIPAGSAGPPTAGGSASSTKGDAQVYVVQMAQDPVVAYDGGEAGLASTRPARGQHVNPNSAAGSPVPGLPRPQAQ